MSLYCTLPRKRNNKNGKNLNNDRYRSSISSMNNQSTTMKNNGNLGNDNALQTVRSPSRGWLYDGTISNQYNDTNNNRNIVVDLVSFAKPTQTLSYNHKHNDIDSNCRLALLSSSSTSTSTSNSSTSPPNQCEYSNYYQKSHNNNYQNIDTLCSTNNIILPQFLQSTNNNNFNNLWTAASFCNDHYNLNDNNLYNNTSTNRIVIGNNNFHSNIISSPTETSDTITFTESATSTFDEYSTSNSIPSTTKLYYACDSIDYSPNRTTETNNRRGKQKIMPNFYGEIINENGIVADDDDDENEDNVNDKYFNNSNNYKNINNYDQQINSNDYYDDVYNDFCDKDDVFQTGASSLDFAGCSLENIDEIKNNNHYNNNQIDDNDEEDDYIIDEQDRKQFERVARMFDLSISNNLKSNQINSNQNHYVKKAKSLFHPSFDCYTTETIKSSSSSFRSRSRQSIRNLSIRLSKFYRPKIFQSSIVAKQNEPTPPLYSRKNDYFCYYPQASTTANKNNYIKDNLLCDGNKSNQLQHHYHYNDDDKIKQKLFKDNFKNNIYQQNNRLKSFLKEKFLKEFSMLKRNQSSSTLLQQSSTTKLNNVNVRKRNSIAECNNHSDNTKKLLNGTRQQSPSTKSTLISSSSSTKSSSLNRYFERFVSSSRFMHMRERISMKKLRSSLNNQSNFSLQSLSSHNNNRNQQSDQQQQQSQSSSMTTTTAGIIKKRPLSMTYDLVRFMQSMNDDYIINYDEDKNKNSMKPQTNRINVDGQNNNHQNKAHMVAAFEQSLSSMTTRLQQLSSTSELKDNELERLRKTIDVLKKQSGSLMVVNGGNIGVNGQTSHQKSATIMNSIGFINNNDNNGDKFQRYLSSESVNSVSSCGAITDSSVGGGNINAKNKKKTKLKLTGTNTSWIRSSFSRAFKKKSSSNSKTRDTSQNGRDAASDVEMTSGTNQSENEDVHSVPSSPLMSVRNRVKSSSLSSSSSSSKPTIQNHNARSLSESKTSGSDTMVEQTSEPEEIRDLRKQLREKEMQLTDMRLESLTSAHQLENLKEMVNQMRVEMMNLKQDNDRLQRLVHHKSLASSQSSMTSALGSHGSSTLPSAIMNNGSIGNSNGIHGHTTTSMDDSNSYDSFVLDMSPSNNSNSDGSSPKLVTLGSGSHTLATLTVTTKTNWEQLDAIIKKCFKDHLIRVDSSLSLGITVDSLACYRVGSEKILRNFYPINHKSTTNDVPELLPFGYLVDENHINLQFKTTIDSLAFDTLTPKSVLNEFITILIENRRLIFSGPSGTGKTYLAHKLAEYMAIKQMDPNSFSNCNNNLLRFHNANPQHMPLPTGSITTFNIDHKNTKELRAYLMNIAEQCQMDLATITTLPAVIILDNLHHSIDSLEDIFNDIEKISLVKSPYIIGTINQSIHHHHQQMTIFQHYNFHCIMLSVNSEAVRGYLNRYLRRKLLETESKLLLNQQKLQPEISKIIEWIPKVYIHLNKFLENYFGENISIGARLFTSCPIDLNGSQAWFTDLWNYSILPFIIENLREHVRQNNGKLKGKSSSNASIHSFIDPTDWIVANYPWTTNSEWSDHLNRLRPEDIEDDGQQQQPTTNTTNIITSRPSSSNNNYQSFDNNKSVSDQLNKSAKDIKDPFLQMLLKLKEASEYSSQDNQIPNTNN